PFVFKVRLSDMTVVASADFSRYFPLQCSTIALDAGEAKVFLFDHTLGRLLVLDAATLQEIRLIGGFGSGNYGQLTRSRWGPNLILAGGQVWLINTDTLQVTALGNSRRLSFVRESANDPSLWYAVSTSPGSTEVGTYNYKTAQWSAKAAIQPQGANWGVMDSAVLPDGSKAYLAVFGGWYPDYRGYGWVYAVDLQKSTVREIPFEGGAMALTVSPDGRRVYAGAGWPSPRTDLIQVLDSQTDAPLKVFQIGQQKFGKYCTQINQLALDPGAGQWLYGTTSDGNALLKLDALSGTVASVLVLNEQTNAPSSFVRQPGTSRAYALLTRTNEALEIDLDHAQITRKVAFPLTRTDFGAFGVAFRDPNTLLVAQGEYFMELATDLTLRAKRNLPSGAPAVWGV
ncbi:MAG TPA: hypothetical protein VN648_29930, partial [Candidatus Methylomirabilis sp.]|nr:hypothetical protein [Candidatus Methylomirabilis sp.]